jgi:hypothetical protein
MPITMATTCESFEPARLPTGGSSLRRGTQSTKSGMISRTSDRGLRSSFALVEAVCCSLLALLVALPSGCGDSREGPTRCRSNAECESSPEAEAIKDVLCGIKEAYCLNDTCHAECRELCSTVRVDTNPCESPGLCAPVKLGPADHTELCTMRPIACTTVDDCPSYLPPLSSGGTAEWTCERGVCAYPEFEYATK